MGTAPPDRLLLLGWRSGTPYGRAAVSVVFSQSGLSNSSRSLLECWPLLQPLADHPWLFICASPARSSGLGSWTPAPGTRHQASSNPSSLGRWGSHTSPFRKVGGKNVVPAVGEASWTTAAFQGHVLLQGWTLPPCMGGAALAAVVGTSAAQVTVQCVLLVGPSQGHVF